MRSANVDRKFTAMVILADGNVLVTGGAQLGMTDESYLPVFYAELFDPVSNEWRLMAKSPTDRRYHSIAILLEDGTVLKAGSHGGLIPARDNIRPQFHADIFQPGYLFRGPRPRIRQLDVRRVGATTTLVPGRATAHWLVVVSDITDDEIDAAPFPEFRLALLRFGGITHGNYMDQRFIWLDPMVVPIPGTQPNPSDRAWEISFRIPANPTIFVPGQYMLFVLDHRGIPSMGEFVTIGLPGRE